MPSLASSVPDLIAAFWRAYRERSAVDRAIVSELAELALDDSAAARALFVIHNQNLNEFRRLMFRENEAKRAALSQLAFGPDLAAMTFH